MSSKMSKKELIEEWSQEIQRAGTLTVLHTNAVATQIGLSATEFEAIDVISRNQPITAGQLALACGLTTGAVTGLIDRIEAAGFVERRKDPKDRRKVLLVPVENSELSTKVRALYQPISEGYMEIANKFTAEELNFLICTQAKMNDMARRVINQLHENVKHGQK